MIEYRVMWADFPVYDILVDTFNNLDDAVLCALQADKNAVPYQNFYIKCFINDVYDSRFSKDGVAYDY